MAQLIALFEHGKTFGSLISAPKELDEKLPVIAERVNDVLAYGGMLEQAAAKSLRPLIEQAQIFADRYDAVVTNPPYMGNRAMPLTLATFINSMFPNSKADLYAAFLEQEFSLNKSSGYLTMITMHGWMFISSFEKLRTELLQQHTGIHLARDTLLPQLLAERACRRCLGMGNSLICDNTLSNKSGNDRLKNRDAGVVPSVARQSKL